MEADERFKILQRHVTMLREHFDSVQVVACHNVEGCHLVGEHEYGDGSWYERYVLMKKWVLSAERFMAEQNQDEPGELSE